MLASSATVAAVARRAADGRLPNLVVDPVLVASTGRPLLDDERRRRLPPTPAPPRPGGHAQHPRGGPAHRRRRRRRRRHGARRPSPGRHRRRRPWSSRAGISPATTPPTWCSSRARSTSSTAPGSLSGNDHGTGCTLSAATAALLARGRRSARRRGPSQGLRRHAPWQARRGGTSGAGHGPLDHFGWGSAPRPSTEDRGRAVPKDAGRRAHRSSPPPPVDAQQVGESPPKHGATGENVDGTAPPEPFRASVSGTL